MNKNLLNKGLEVKDEIFLEKEKKTLTIAKITNSKELAKSKDFLLNLVTSYRDVFGHWIPVDKAGWDEYVKCETCDEHLSIEDTYWLLDYHSLHEIEKEWVVHPDCPKCEKEMELFYNPNDLVEEITEQMNRKFYWAILFDETWDVCGFNYWWISTIEKIWKEKFSLFYAQSRLTFKDFLEQIEKNTNWKIKKDTEVFYWAENWHSFPNRGIDVVFSMSRSALEGVWDEKFCILSTMPSSRAYWLSRGCWWEIICETNDHPLEILATTVWKYREEIACPASEFQKKNGAKIREALKKKKLKKC